MGVGARGGMEAARRRQAGPRGTKNGPVSCPGFVARGTQKSKNRDQKTGQFSGPENGPKNCPVFWSRFFDFRVRWDLVLDGGGFRFWSFGGPSLGRIRRGPKGPTRGQFWNILLARYRCAGGACAWHLFWTFGLSCAGWHTSCLPFRHFLFVQILCLERRFLDRCSPFLQPSKRTKSNYV